LPTSSDEWFNCLEAARDSFSALKIPFRSVKTSFEDGGYRY